MAARNARTQGRETQLLAATCRFGLVDEKRAIFITVIAGLAGMISGAVIAASVGASTPQSEPVLGDSLQPGLVTVLVAAGFILGPWIALRAAGFRLAEVTAALAAIWVLLLILAVGPVLDAIGPSWFPVVVALAALAIARAIAGPFAPYLEPA